MLQGDTELVPESLWWIRVGACQPAPAAIRTPLRGRSHHHAFSTRKTRAQAPLHSSEGRCILGVLKCWVHLGYAPTCADTVGASFLRALCYVGHRRTSSAPGQVSMQRLEVHGGLGPTMSSKRRNTAGALSFLTMQTLMRCGASPCVQE